MGIPNDNGLLDVIGVVVTYNNDDDISQCLQSLLDSKLSRVIVVDNASSDDTASIVRNKFPTVELIENPRNVGYGAAINVAAKECQSKFLLIVNADCVLQGVAAQELVEFAKKNDSVAIVGPTIQNSDLTRYPSPRVFPGTVDAIGHGLLGFVKPTNRWSSRYKLTDMEFTVPTVVDWVSGACMLIRTSSFRELKGFDERYFMYMEDVDLCWRAREFGWQTGFVPQAKAIHSQGASSRSHPVRSIIHHHQSLIRFTSQTTKGSNVLLLPFVWLGIVARGTLLIGQVLLRGKKRLPDTFSK